jgi:dynactin-4
LIKPEQKAQSVRYKIKLVAANYLPAVTVSLPHAQRYTAEAAKRSLAKLNSATTDERKSPSDIQAGKTYLFQLALSNPLYDPIQVRLSVQRVHVSATTNDAAGGEKSRRPPFAISLPTSSFSVAAFAEAWEYEDDEDMFGVEDDDDVLGRGGQDNDGRGKSKTVGVLEKRANVTLIGGEVVIGKEARGNVKARNYAYLGHIRC